jgi:hypothetical protein
MNDDSRGSHENRLSGAKHRREFLAIELRKDTEKIRMGRTRSGTTVDRTRVHESIPRSLLSSQFAKSLPNGATPFLEKILYNFVGTSTDEPVSNRT